MFEWTNNVRIYIYIRIIYCMQKISLFTQTVVHKFFTFFHASCVEKQRMFLKSTPYGWLDGFLLILKYSLLQILLHVHIVCFFKIFHVCTNNENKNVIHRHGMQYWNPDFRNFFCAYFLIFTKYIYIFQSFLYHF